MKTKSGTNEAPECSFRIDNTFQVWVCSNGSIRIYHQEQYASAFRAMINHKNRFFHAFLTEWFVLWYQIACSRRICSRRLKKESTFCVFRLRRLQLMQWIKYKRPLSICYIPLIHAHAGGSVPVSSFHCQKAQIVFFPLFRIWCCFSCSHFWWLSYTIPYHSSCRST